MIEVNKDAQTVAEFIGVPTERVNELSQRYEGKNIFEILADACDNPEYNTAERLAIWFQVGFNFGQQVLMAETMSQAQELATKGQVH